MATIIHAVIGYVLLTLVVRVLTRRPGAQMTLFEFVIVFLMGGVIILSTVGNDRSMTNCCCAILAVASMHRLVSGLKMRYPRFGIVLVGTPLVLVRKGELQQRVMNGMNIAEEDIMASARLNGLRSFDQIDYAILERNGGISIMKKEDGNQGGDSQTPGGGQQGMQKQGT
ncbi:DUF421 domain-containing protein [Terriglobus sp.]|uniref:DUF421 domain-containing protein n=1 Tax=Terriglobus sp. TaxID=1889013 RepID=UPI003AFFBA20